MNPFSRNTLRVQHPAALQPPDLSLDADVLPFQRDLNARRPPVAVGHHANVRSAETQFPSHATENVARKLRSIQGGVHIIWQGNGEPRNAVPLENSLYLLAGFSVNRKMHKQDNAPVRPELGEKLRALRRGRGLTQPELARILGLRHQSAVSRWERGDDRPPIWAILKIAEMVPEAERQWWQDQARARAAAPEGNLLEETSALLPIEERCRAIRFIANSNSGDKGQMSGTAQALTLPSEWFASGGTFRALKVDPISEEIQGECIALVDVSNRDAKSLVDCVVAARTARGIEPRWLRATGDDSFVLQGLVGGTVRTLQYDGEDSIVGRVVKWIGDAPAPKLPSNSEVARRLRRRK
jgi:transcriptional regulator with XRE-family HTH domain